MVKEEKEGKVPGDLSFRANVKHFRITPFSTGRGETAVRFLVSPGPAPIKNNVIPKRKLIWLKVAACVDR